MAEHPSNRPPVNEMVNGHHDVSIANSSVKNTEEMLEQIKQLILENNNLKETMKVKNQVMKDRLERLYELFKSRFLEVDRTSLELRRENELLRKQNQILKETMEEPPHEASDNSASEEGTETPRQVKAQLLRLRAEKADLLGIISELQLKLNSYSSEDSFIEVRFPDQEACGDQNEMKIISGNAAHEDLAYSSKSIDEEKNCMESEEMTVRQLLHSLREEIQKVETLEKALTIANERIAQMEKPNVDSSEKDIQTDLDTSKGDGPCAEAFASELDTLKLKVKTLNKELQDTTEKLNEAEQLKRRLQDKCIILDKSLSENKVDLEERQQLVYSIKTLELQMESMKAEIKMEQDKTEDEKKQYYALWEEFNKQKYDYDDLKKRESEKVPKAQFNELCQKLDVCEKALAKKQIQIDEMNEIVTKHKEDLETIALLRAQIDVYCSDFHAEREARENIHQERERLATQLTIMMEENEKLNAEVMGRHTMEDFQRRHSFKNSGNGYESPHLVQRGADSREQPTLTTFTCPKCSVTVPDMDTLQIHVMDCIT